MTKIVPEYVYNLKVIYEIWGWRTYISVAGTDLCGIQKVGIDPTIWIYGFEDAASHPLGKSDFDEPLLGVEEHRDPDTNQLTHLIFTIREWEGEHLGRILWGSNNVEIWTEGELESPPPMNVGKKKAISVNLIRDPMITGVEPPPPPPPPPTLWARTPWYLKASLATIPLIATWQLTKRKK